MEQAVIVHLRLTVGAGSADERRFLEVLENELAAEVAAASVGEFDGDLVGEGECVLYFYGQDADLLFATIRPVLNRAHLAAGGRAVKRYGAATDQNAQEIIVPL